MTGLLLLKSWNRQLRNWLQIRTTIYIATSLDGFIASVDGSVDWLFQEGDYGYAEFFNSVDSIVQGRKTYEQVLGFGPWPYKGKRSYLQSRTASRPMKHIDQICRNIEELYKHLDEYNCQHLWIIGGGEVNQAMIESERVTDLYVYIHPTILGQGIPLTASLSRRSDLQLMESKAYETGLVEIHYTFPQR